MAYITGKIPNGNCFPMEFSNGVYDVWPEVGKSYYRMGDVNLWCNFHAKIIGKIGEEIKIRLNWPFHEHYMVNGGYGNGGTDPFCYLASPLHPILPDFIYVSPDQIHWTRLDRSQTGFEINQETILIRLKLETEESYIAVGYPYTKAMLDKLYTDVKDSEFVEFTQISKELGLECLHMYTCTDFTVPTSEKRTVWFHAAQHCDEVMGSNLADAMIRYLISPEAEEIRKKYVFRIIPVVAVWSWLEGRGRHYYENPNRDWNDLKNPENKAVDKIFREVIASGENVIMTLDAHTGLSVDPPRIDVCPGSIWLDADLGDQMREESTRFANCLVEKGNFPPLICYMPEHRNRQYCNFNRYAYSFGIKRFHILECGRTCCYDSKNKTTIPYSDEVVKEWGKVFTDAVCEFLDTI